MKKISLIAFVFIQFSSVNAQWTLVLERDSIAVYNRPNHDGYSFYKARVSVNVPIEKIFSFLVDISRYPEWVNNVDTTILLSAEKNKEYIYYTHYNLPWPVTNRHAVSRIEVVKKEKNYIELNSLPAPEFYKDEFQGIAMTRFHENIKLTRLSSTATMLELYGAYDSGGVIPSWVNDKVMKFGPYDTIIKLRKKLYE